MLPIEWIDRLDRRNGVRSEDVLAQAPAIGIVDMIVWPRPVLCMRPALAMPRIAILCADQTCLALFFFLCLGV